MSCCSSCLIIPPKVFPKSLLPVGYGSGLRLLRFSGDTEPVGSLTRAAAASVSSPSSALAYSGLLSLESLLRLPNVVGFLFQKTELLLPCASRRHAGGLLNELVCDFIDKSYKSSETWELVSRVAQALLVFLCLSSGHSAQLRVS